MKIFSFLCDSWDLSVTEPILIAVLLLSKKHATFPPPCLFYRKDPWMRLDGLSKMSFHCLLSTKKKKLWELQHSTTGKMENLLMSTMNR